MASQMSANQQDDRLLAPHERSRLSITCCLWHGAAVLILMDVDVSPSAPKASRRLLTLKSGHPAEC